MGYSDATELSVEYTTLKPNGNNFSVFLETDTQLDWIRGLCS